LKHWEQGFEPGLYAVEAGRKPRTGLKQVDQRVVLLEVESKQGENPERD